MRTRRDWNVIFKDLASKYGNKEITDLLKIKEFFEELIKKTDGWVIVEFLDMSNWDRIEKFEINDQNGLLTLIWHDYRGVNEDPIDKEMRQMVFPASLYSLGIAIKTIVPIIGKQSTIFLLNGYSKTNKEIKTLYKKDASFKLSDNSFFEKHIVRKINNHWEVIEFHCTPIYSLAILPKGIGFSSVDSEILLYLYNIRDAIERMEEVVKALDQTDNKAHDFICEKVNTARRILEYILKVKCCYRDIKIKKDYSKIRLGRLFNYIKTGKGGNCGQKHIQMISLLNEFSHDTGKKIDIDNAKLVCRLVMEYISSFYREINDYKLSMSS